jgi:putative membrane protein
MTVLTRRAALMLAPLAAGALAGCQTTQAVATSPASDMSPSDLEFVANAFNVIEFDRQECTLAQTQAMSPQVKAIAAKLLADANNFDAALRPIAAEAGIKPPTVLRTDLRVRAGRLRLGQGRSFDRAFIEDQIVSHQDSLNLDEMIMSQPSTNPKLAELSRRGHDLVQSNLEALRAIQRQMMTGR